MAAQGLPGPERVNIVFVDTGLPPNLLPASGLRGWPVLEDPADFTGPVRLPGNPLSPHGEMVARNARGVVRLFPTGPSADLRLPSHSELLASPGVA